MIATVTGVFEGTSTQINDGKPSTSMILNQIGQDEKLKIKIEDGFKLPAVGEKMTLVIQVRKGVYNGKPFVSLKVAPQ